MKPVFLSLLLWTSGLVFGQVSVTLCHPFELTPTTSTELMCGKQYSLVISSDANDLWSGGLFIRDPYRQVGKLSGRDRDPNTRDFKGSHMPAAGPYARAVEWNDSCISGFDLYTDDLDCFVGKWFVIDYTAVQPGTCEIGFYDHDYSWTQPDPNTRIVLTNIVNRDLNNDNIVNLSDYSLFAEHWQEAPCSNPTWCGGCDMNRDGQVWIEDLALFSEYWLWGSPGWQPNPETPGEPDPTIPDPNLVFGIVDANSLSEINLYVQDTVTLYLSKQSNGQPIYLFYLETKISDPNLGTIDNTPIDPNIPDAGTARILVTPREPFFDYYGPGYFQPEGIQLLAVSFAQPLYDGAMASFQYTAKAPGDVTLELLNNDTQPARLNKILIHQAIRPVAAAAPEASAEIASTEELVEFLETVWQTDSELQSTMSQQEWNTFVNSVEQTGTTESGTNE